MNANPPASGDIPGENSGDIPAEAAAGAVALSLVWTLALVLLGRGVLARGFRRVVVQGG